MAKTVEDYIRNNVFVYTGNFSEPYKFYCQNPFMNFSKQEILDISLILANATWHQSSSTPSMQYTKWSHLSRDNGLLIVRCVCDGRTDQDLRSIYRIEGTLIPDIDRLETVYPMLEEVLLEKQIESDNYGYGDLENYLPKDHLNIDDRRLTQIGNVYQDENGQWYLSVEDVIYPVSKTEESDEPKDRQNVKKSHHDTHHNKN